MKKQKKSIFILLLISLMLFSSCSWGAKYKEEEPADEKSVFTIISGSENAVYEQALIREGEKHNIDVRVQYYGNLDIMDKLNAGGEYDGVWASNSIWLYMLKDSSAIKNSKFTSITPVVFAVDRQKAQELGYVGADVSMKKIVSDMKKSAFRLIMPSVTQTNAGASFYLGMLSSLSGSPQVLTEKHLQNKNLKKDLLSAFKCVVRTAGDEDFLQDLYLKNDYDAVVSYESSIIELNKKLESQGKEPLYLIYPTEGVPMSDSPFAYVERGQNKEEEFEILQSFLLGDEMQKTFLEGGRRVWYGGANEQADKSVFNPQWGIDASKYLQVSKYPGVSVIKKALSIYQSALKKPTKIVFCLDYSGSMTGEGNYQLTQAMQYILASAEAKANYLNFTSDDEVSIIPFDANVIDVITAKDAGNPKELLDFVEQTKPYGGTNIYDSSIRALEMLAETDENEYNCSIVLMTDGLSNYGRYEDLEMRYKALNKDIPIYSIMFGYADQSQLTNLAELSGGKIFDGRTDLLAAFKAVRGFN